MKEKVHHAILSALMVCLVLLFGCAVAEYAEYPKTPAAHFADLLSRHSQTKEPLGIRKLAEGSSQSIPGSSEPVDVSIIVHPAYSVFFRDRNREKYPEATYRLMKKQFDDETRFIAERSKSGDVMILVLPASDASDSDSLAPFTFYLNRATSASSSVFYIFSGSSSSGTLSMNDMIILYRFLRQLKVGRVLIGGGYIGRCQRQFYNQLTTYFDKERTYIVPEISTISPEDISEREASRIFSSLMRQDYAPVSLFIDKKTDDGVNILSIPQKRDL